MCVVLGVVVFFFKQKTAYEISTRELEFRRVLFRSRGGGLDAGPVPEAGGRRHHAAHQIGRASCRERVEISVVAVSLKKKTKNTYFTPTQQNIILQIGRGSGSVRE